MLHFSIVAFNIFDDFNTKFYYVQMMNVFTLDCNGDLPQSLVMKFIPDTDMVVSLEDLLYLRSVSQERVGFIILPPLNCVDRDLRLEVEIWLEVLGLHAEYGDEGEIRGKVYKTDYFSKSENS